MTNTNFIIIATVLFQTNLVKEVVLPSNKSMEQTWVVEEIHLIAYTNYLSTNVKQFYWQEKPKRDPLSLKDITPPKKNL